MNTLSYRSIWQLAGPNIASNILMVSISFAHLWIIAPFGPEASAAVVTGGRIHFLLMSASMALSVATTAVVARAWGAENLQEASEATTSSLTLAVLISLGLGSVTFLFAESIVGLFGLDPTSSQLAVDYVRPSAILNVLFALALTVFTAFRAIGDVVRPLRFSAIATLFGTLGAYALVHGSLGLPEMGMAGIPWGTAAGQLLVVLWFSFRWLTRQYTLFPTTHAIFDTARLKQLAKIGMPAAMEQVVLQSSLVLFMILVADYGTAAFAAYGIGITILSICIVIGMGFGAASAALSGQNLGAQDPEAARTNGWMAMKMAIVCMTVVALITYAFKTPLAAILSIDPDIRRYTEFFIVILAIVQPLMAIEFAIGSALRGSGETRFPLIVTFIGVVLVRFGIGFVVIMFDGPVEAIYAVIIADYLVKATLLIMRFRSDIWIKGQDDHAPLAVQSLAGLSRAPIRSYFSRKSRKN